MYEQTKSNWIYMYMCVCAENLIRENRSSNYHMALLAPIQINTRKDVP